MSELNIQDNYSSTKVKHLTDALCDAINHGKYTTGQVLPSVNQLSRQYNLSRDTVFKAYRELKKRGIVDSTPAKGYHVAGMMNKVLLMLDIYSPFKDVLYNSFVSKLPKNFKVDLVFHFYNEHLFETVIADSIGRYNHYVIMNFSNEVLHDTLRKIDPSKLLILDLGDFDKKDHAYVCQDFGRSVYHCLSENIRLLQKYKQFVLYLPDESEHPKILIKYFKRFVKDHKFEAAVIKTPGKFRLMKDAAYLIIRQKDLVETVKRCRAASYRIGEDIGLIAYNDTPMYEIIENGITVISTDFKAMGQKAAEFVKTREKVKELIPARMIVRGSL
jgi:DNA-binding transcriptional regulator YhcF (GntR family)